MALTPGFKKFVGLLCTVAVVGGGLFAYRHGYLGNHDGAPSNPPETTMSPSTSVPPAAVQPVSTATNPVGYTANANTLKAIRDNGIVRISVENPSEPFFGETGGIPHGFNVEFAQLLISDPSFTANGRPITIDTRHEVDTYAGVPQQLLQVDRSGNHTVDIAMDGLTFSDNTPAGVVYSVPYVDDFGYALIVRRGSTIHSTGDLAGKTVGILKGDPDVRAFVTREYPDTRFVEIDDADPAFIAKGVDSRQVDAFIYDYPFAVSAIKGTDLRFAVTRLDGSNIAYKIGVRAQDQDLLVYVNAAIAKVKTSPAYLALLQKYFTSNQVETIAAGAGEHAYTVRQGDTLNLIASSQLGNGARYRELQRRNNLANPNLILVGQALVIPAR
ncbi:ABC-type amino acid transport substrate-binding protein [Paraburkholderia eburnea]|uniref:ABC-type amino acid transport substrate-binding protein n=1 Tax=Paraburkholderia eburnea TaxID=1189126 RepID=A0A2S4MJY8_9BURK|nr:transporter substrate-binding domain-containing protein [Paraburkholderia eburnea]POR55076.1 ABC-type amino acid transport substrate-binding protein [Paraburkholderia eburnea]PRZ24324.1 ABC-type amino acid transport substrate-binding protein [Paraburkholderia eburnea]